MTAAVATAAAVLVLVVASPTLFVSAVGGAAIRSDIVDGCRYGIGLTVLDTAPLPGTTNTGGTRGNGNGNGGDGDPSFDDRLQLLRDLRHRTPGAAAPVVTLTSGPVDLSSGRERPGDGQVQLMTRTGGERQVHWVAGGPGPGLSLPDGSAELLHVGPGDDLDVVIDGEPVRSHVDGVFQDLAYADRSSFWCSTERAFEPFGVYTPPPVVLVGEPEYARLLRTAGRSTTDARWELPPDADGLAMPVAHRASRVLRRQAVALRSEPTGPRNPFDFQTRFAIGVGLTSSVVHAAAVGDAVRPLVQTLGVASFAIALLVVIGAGRHWSEARAGEVRLLASKGVSPAALGVKAGLEMAPATVVGGAVGFVLARVLVVHVGPSDLVGTDAVRRASWMSVVAVVVGLLLLGVVAARRLAASERRRDRPGRRASWSRLPWELALLGAAAVAFGQLRSPTGRVGGVAGTSYPADVLLVLFPLLLFAGGAGLAARALLLLVPRLRRRGTRLPLPLLLAVRRLGAAGPTALALVAATSVSIGILLYSSVVVASARATVLAKATVGAGTDLVVFPGVLHPTVPPALASRASNVTRSEADLSDGRGRVAILAVSRATFEGSAFFDPSFSSSSLHDLLTSLEPGPGRIPAIAVGTATVSQVHLDVGGQQVALDVTGRAKAFPGQRGGVPMLVVDESVLDRIGLSGATELWIRGDPVTAVAGLRAARYDFIHTVRAADGLAFSSLLPLATSLDYFRALGLLGGAVTLSGVVLYLMARARERGLASVMTRRMGLRRRAEVAAAAVEVMTLLLLGLAVAAAMALPAAVGVFPHLDPSPGSPPPPLVRLQLHVLAGSAVACVLIAVVVAAGAVFSAQRRPASEVMRLVP